MTQVIFVKRSKDQKIKNTTTEDTELNEKTQNKKKSYSLIFSLCSAPRSPYARDVGMVTGVLYSYLEQQTAALILSIPL